MPPTDARRLDLARRNLEATVSRTLETHKMASVFALNRFVAIGGDQLFPTPDNTYLGCWYRFGQDQLLFVRGRLPRARYVSFCLYNAWMESLDYTRARVSLNHRQIQTAPDGSFELCLAHRDPAHPNWLDTTGHAAGYVLVRALLAEEPIPEPTVEVRYAREVGR